MSMATKHAPTPGKQKTVPTVQTLVRALEKQQGPDRFFLGKAEAGTFALAATEGLKTKTSRDKAFDRAKEAVANYQEKALERIADRVSSEVKEKLEAAKYKAPTVTKTVEAVKANIIAGNHAVHGINGVKIQAVIKEAVTGMEVELKIQSVEWFSLAHKNDLFAGVAPEVAAKGGPKVKATAGASTAKDAGKKADSPTDKEKNAKGGAFERIAALFERLIVIVGIHTPSEAALKTKEKATILGVTASLGVIAGSIVFGQVTGRVNEVLDIMKAALLLPPLSWQVGGIIGNIMHPAKKTEKD